MRFFIAMNPPTITYQQHKVSTKNGKPVFYDPPELKDARANLRARLSKHVPEIPMRGALRLIVKWCFPNGDKHGDGEYRITKPDTDNLNKLLKDVMTDLGFWMDDAQVASEVIEKFWAEVPGIYISVEVIG